jgi:alpha-beta hydrolase superfamily lysophospholipase
VAVTRRHAVSAARGWGVGLTVVGGIAALAAVGWASLSLIVARTVVTPPRRRVEDIRILAVGTSRIVLSSTPDSRLPGDYSFWFSRDLGYARLGEIVDSTADTVTRRIIDVEVGDLSAATRGRMSGWYYLDPRELGYPVDDLELQTELGPAPAWLVPAESASSRWVIQVHGRAVRRQETIRAIPVFRENGYHTLIVSYRNDGDAPASADGLYALGDSEWHDVDAGLRYAIDNGATDVVLMGWSMGGATVLQELTRSDHAGIVRGVVLDSPVIDWVTALRFQGDIRRLPAPVSSGALAFIGSKWGRRFTGQTLPVDFPRLDFVARANELHVPILLMHSDDDGFVPNTASRELAARRPDIVTYEAFAVAGHTKLWNFDRVRWNSAISQWLSDLG